MSINSTTPLDFGMISCSLKGKGKAAERAKGEKSERTLHETNLEKQCHTCTTK
jgi:hypothetical protein